MRNKKKLKTNISKIETKAQLEPQRKLNFSIEETQQIATEAVNTHPHISMKVSVTVVL